jgi:hypothetical protein
MYALWLAVWEAPIVIMILLANRHHLLTHEQAALAYPGMKTAVLLDHRGIIGGDILLVSPLCAWMVTHYASWWKGPSVGVAALIAQVCSCIMLYTWAEASRKNGLIESFNNLGMTSTNGWVHGTYLFASLTVIFLSFFATPLMSPTFVWVAVAGLGIHITVGLIQPEYHTYGTVSPQTITTVVIVWLILLGRGLFLADR